ncbi:LysR substrate-binding domain-containing protein [Caballeronia novacaledonica]|uniref:LysR substrate-binding domain-containing protein n=1 Tax=Caballeronia novacaledonica TaxID=1544861 RepID=UPI001EE31D58|nr:LysR substrate-binding domain-containing protein [Caballeronia novacaledonica]
MRCARPHRPAHDSARVRCFEARHEPAIEGRHAAVYFNAPAAGRDRVSGKPRADAADQLHGKHARPFVAAHAAPRTRYGCVSPRIAGADRRLYVSELYSDEILVVAPNNHPLHRHSHVTWRDAAAWPWIMPSMGSPMRTALEVEFATAGVAAPHVLMESTSHQTNCAVARRVPCLFVSTRLRRGETDLNGELRQLPLKVSTAVQRIGALTAEPQSTAVSMVLAALQAASGDPVSAQEK